MRILLLNQTFYPDVVSTAQHLTDLALALKSEGHEVTVVASRRGYDNPDASFPAKENWRGIQIHRVASTRFGKQAKWRRAVDFASFILFCCWRLAFLPRQDAVVALTSPPLISFIAAWFTRLRGGKFFYWVMDLNPDEAIAAGWLRQGSIMAKLLERMSRFSFRSAERIIALDRFMAERIRAKGISAEKIKVIPPWSHDGQVQFDAAGRERFRAAHGLTDKFMVMYSGNHSPCHPLDTLLGAAKRMQENGRENEAPRGAYDHSRKAGVLPPHPNPLPRGEGELFGSVQAGLVTSDLMQRQAEWASAEVVFCFVGGGSEFKRVQDFKKQHGLKNMLCLPYQPMEELSASLSAADLQVVVMGEPFVGIVHPCKIYNVLTVGAPVFYIGPKPSHLTEILTELPAEYPRAEAAHGEEAELVRMIGEMRLRATGFSGGTVNGLDRKFSESLLLSELVAALSLGKEWAGAAALGAVPPHPGLLPRGEGITLAARRTITNR